MLTCGYCGFKFDPDCAPQSCSGCPIAPSCSHLSCPRCGYPVLPEARLISWIKKITRKSISMTEKKSI